MRPLESAVQAEGSFAFNRIADLAARFASQACLGPPTALFVHAQKSGCRVPAVLLLYGWWKLGVEIACEHPYGVMAAFVLLRRRALLIPPSVAQKQPAACGQPLLGDRSSHG